MSRLLPGATLSEGAVAAAASVVSGRIPAFEVYAGNPAVFLRKRQMYTANQSAREYEAVAS
jgi:putative colanic acid biosynthesis acetyltransferase WcaF